MNDKEYKIRLTCAKLNCYILEKYRTDKFHLTFTFSPIYGKYRIFIHINYNSYLTSNFDIDIDNYDYNDLVNTVDKMLQEYITMIEEQ